MAILDTYSNVTAAWSMDRVIVGAYGGALYTTATGVSSWNDQTGNGRHLTHATAANQPTVSTAGGQSRACMNFDGTNDHLIGAALSNFITNTTGYIIGVAIPKGAGHPDDPLFADSSNIVAVRFYTGPSIGGYKISAFNNTGGSATVDYPATFGGPPLVMEWRHESGTLYLRVNGDTWVNVSSGTSASMTGLFRVGTNWNGGAYSEMSLFELVTFSAVPNDTDKNALVADMLARYSGSTIFANKLAVSAAYKYQDADDFVDALNVNKMYVEAAYKYQDADDFVDAQNVNKVYVQVVQRTLPFYMSGSNVLVNSLTGFDLGAYPLKVRAQDSAAAYYKETINIYILEVGAPALHTQSSIRTAGNTADVTVTTTGSTGTLYWVVTTSDIHPTRAQVIAGQNHLGAAGTTSGNVAIGSTGIKTNGVTGLTGGVPYYVHFHHVAVDAKVSNIVTAAISTTVVITGVAIDVNYIYEATAIAGATVGSFVTQSGTPAYTYTYTTED